MPDLRAHDSFIRTAGVGAAERESNGEGRAGSELALEGDTSAEYLKIALDEMQAEACTARKSACRWQSGCNRQ